PSNEGRGSVLRRIMNRASYHGQTLGLNEPFLYRMSRVVVDMMKDAYPELVESAYHVAKAIKIEEKRYADNTKKGLEELEPVRVLANKRKLKQLTGEAAVDELAVSTYEELRIPFWWFRREGRDSPSGQTATAEPITDQAEKNLVRTAADKGY